MNLKKFLQKKLYIPKWRSGNKGVTPPSPNHWLWGSGDVILFGGGDAIRLHHNGNDYHYLSQIKPLLHLAVYHLLEYDNAKHHFENVAPSVGGCSAIRVGNFFGRNLDWYEQDTTDPDAQPDFIVKTPLTKKYKGVVGVASIPNMTEAMAVQKQDSELWRLLPFYLQDGINTSGVFACINVVPRDKGQNTYTIPTIEKKDEICATMIVRYVLDRFATATEAVEYLQKYVSIYMPTNLSAMDYDVHYMIGDKDKTYVVEIVNNTVVYKEHNIMTNFHIDGVNFLPNGKVYTNADAVDGHLASSLGITEHGSGLERYNILVESNDDMRTLMNKVLYSKAYDLAENPYWYSEFTNSGEHEVTVDTLPTDENMQYMVEAAQEIKRGEREGRLWQTTHSCVYNIADKTLNIVSFEDTTDEYNIGIY